MKEALELLKAIPKRVENVSSNPADVVAVLRNIRIPHLSSCISTLLKNKETY